jgi:integrase
MKNVWYRASEGNWYVTFRENGRRRQVLLVKAPNTREGKKLAEEQLVEELSTRKYQEAGPATHSRILVAHVLDGFRFLNHSQEEHDPATYDWYKNFLDSFKAKWGKLRITLVKKNHVQAWLKDKGYNPTSQNRAISAIKRAFNWAVDEEHIAKSPVAHLPKSNALVRDRILTVEERELILTSIKGQAFREFVRAMTLTGCPVRTNSTSMCWITTPARSSRSGSRIAGMTAGASTFPPNSCRSSKKAGLARL